jgi:hypothetical protein
MDEPPSATFFYPKQTSCSPDCRASARHTQARSRSALDPNPSEPVLGHSHIVAARAMPNHKTLEDLFSETIKDIYFAESQILRALPKMAKESSSPELKQAATVRMTPNETLGRAAAQPDPARGAGLHPVSMIFTRSTDNPHSQIRWPSLE